MLKGKELVLLFMTEPSVRTDSNELRLLWKADQYRREKFLYLKGSSIGWKKFQRVHPKPFLTNFQFFEKFYYRQKLYFLWPTLQSELVQMNCVSCKRLSNVLEESFITWNDLVFPAKSSKDCTPTHFWQLSSFFEKF